MAPRNHRMQRAQKNITHLAYASGAPLCAPLMRGDGTQAIPGLVTIRK